jgi:uncharacterized membrane protein
VRASSSTRAAAPRDIPVDGTADLDRAIARLLTFGTYLGIALLAVGVVLLALAGRSPVAPAAFPSFDAQRVPEDLASGRAEGFLWLGLVTVIATPTARVIAALVGYARTGDRRMVAVSLGILAVIATSVAVGLLSSGSAA